MGTTTLGDLVVALGFDASGLMSGASALENQMQQTGTRMFFLGSRISAAFSIPLGFAVDRIAEFGLAFNQAMTESLAIMDKVTPQIRARMEEQAKAVSETTKYTSVEAAKAYYDLASAGFTAEQAIEALPTVAQFAQAGMMDLAHAGEYLAGAQTALGLKSADATVNMQNMGKVADELTTINNKALGTIQDYASALTNKGGQAIRMYGLSLEQGIATLGAFGQQHILASQAGGLLYQFLRDLTGAAVKHADAFKQAGIAVFDANGRMRDMADIVDDITRKLGPMNAEGRRTELQFLGISARAQQGFNALIGMGDSIRGYEEALKNAGGATKQVADNQMLSLTNQLKVIHNQFQNIEKEIFDEFVPAFNKGILPIIQDAVKYFKEFADWLGRLDESTKIWILRITAVAVALGPLITAIGGLVLVARALFTGVTLLAGAWSTLAVGATNGSMALALGLSNPYVLGGAAVLAGIAFGLYEINKNLNSLGGSGNIGKPLQGVVDDFGHVKMTISEANDKLKDFKGTLDGLTFNGKPLTVTGGGPNGPGAPPPGPGAPPDQSVTKHIQNILDRISGKTVLADAAVWYAAIMKLKGGIESLADADTQTALNIFDNALDRLQKRGDGLSATAAKYSEVWLALADINNIGKIKFGVPSSVVEPGSGSYIRTAVEGIDKDFLHALKVLENMQARNPVRETVGRIGLTISKEDLKKMLPADDFQKQMDIITNQFGAMASELGRLGREIGGSVGNALLGVAQFALSMQSAGKAGKEFNQGLDLLNKGGKDILPGLLNIAQAGMQIVGSFMAATNSASMVKNVLGGMATLGMAGAEIGSKLGGPMGAAIGGAIGAAIGGIAALIKGRPEWANVADEVGRLMGVHISQKLAQSIVDNASNFGGSIQASMIASLGKIIQEAGGLTKDNWQRFAGTLRDTFSMVETHQMTLAQATQNLDENFQNFVKNGTDGLGFLDAKLVEIIKLNKQFGTDAKAIADYLTSQGDAVASGFNKIAIGGVKPLNDLFDLLNKGTSSIGGGLTGTTNPSDQEKYVVGLIQQTKDLQASIDTIKQKIAKGSATPLDIQHLEDYKVKLVAVNAEIDKMNTDQAGLSDTLKKKLEGSQEEFDRLGRLANVAFGVSIASGKSFLQALDAIGPGLDQMSTAASHFGLTQSDAFGKLLNIRNFVNANKDLVGELDGVNTMMTGLANMGLLTQDTFSDLGAEALSVFKRMTANGLDSNSALLLMQPTLQRLWEGEDRFGLKVDDATQALIDMGVESGLVGEQGKTDSQKMVDGIKELNETLKDLVLALTGKVPDAFKDLASKATSQIDQVKGGLQDLSNTPVHIHIETDADLGGPPKLAGGGIVMKRTLIEAGERGPEAIIPLTPGVVRGLNGGSSGGDVILMKIGSDTTADDVWDALPDKVKNNYRGLRTKLSQLFG